MARKNPKMWQLSNLQQLPTVALDNADRELPHPQITQIEGVSTVEAGYLALTALEGEGISSPR